MRRCVPVLVVMATFSLWPTGTANATCIVPPTVADPEVLTQADAAFVGTVIEHRDEVPSIPSIIKKKYRDRYDTILFSVEYDVHGNLGETVEAVAGAPGWGTSEGTNFDYEEGTRLGTVLYLEEGHWFAPGYCPGPADSDDFIAAAENVVPARNPVTGPPGPPLPGPRRTGIPALGLSIAVGVAIGLGVVAQKSRRRRGHRVTSSS